MTEVTNPVAVALALRAPIAAPSRRAVAVSTVPLVVYRALGGGLPILCGLVIAPLWGLAEAGAYTVAYAWIALAAAICDWGASRALPRDFAVEGLKERAARVARVNGVRCLSMLGVAAFLVVAVATGSVAPVVARYLTVLWPWVPATLLSTNGLADRLVTRQLRGVWMGCVASLLTVGGVAVGVLTTGRSPRVLVAGMVVGKLIETVCVVRGRAWVSALAWRGLRGTVACLGPFSVQIILGVACSRLAVFTVEHWTTETQLGIFSVAMALQTGLLLVPTSLALLLLPALTIAHKLGTADELRRLLRRYALGAAAGLLLGLTLLTAVVHPLAGRLGIAQAWYGFLVAVAALALLSAPNVLFGYLLQAAGEERRLAQLSTATLAIAFSCQWFALSRWGLWGIVPAMWASEATAALILGRAWWRRVRANQ